MADPKPASSVSWRSPDPQGLLQPSCSLPRAASTPLQSLQWPQGPVQTPQRGMLVFVRPQAPQLVRAACSPDPSPAAPSHAITRPSHSPVVGFLVLPPLPPPCPA